MLTVEYWLHSKAIRFGFTCMCVGLATFAHAQTAPTTYTLSNEKLRIEVNLLNSSIKSVTRKGHGGGLNPLSWKLTQQQMPANNRSGEPFMGHFLCTNRWGSPSAREMAAGITHNGEVNTIKWQILKSSNSYVKTQHISVNEHLKVDREIVLATGSEKFTVVEIFENTSALDRVWNVVQHPTLGAPFLRKETQIFSNATWGFDQRTSSDSLAIKAYHWPHAHMKEGYVDLTSSLTPFGYVSTHVFNPADSIGFVVARNPDGSFFGYCWAVDDYPWLNLWHHYENGQPVSKGLEFGTTGKGIDYFELLTKGVAFHNHLSWDYFTAKAKKSKEYTGFYFSAPSLKNVASIRRNDSAYMLTDSDGNTYMLK